MAPGKLRLLIRIRNRDPIPRRIAVRRLYDNKRPRRDVKIRLLESRLKIGAVPPSPIGRTEDCGGAEVGRAFKCGSSYETRVRSGVRSFHCNGDLGGGGIQFELPALSRARATGSRPDQVALDVERILIVGENGNSARCSLCTTNKC